MLEKLIRKRKAQSPRSTGPFCLGSFSPTVVDAFLVPQLYNARRWGVDVDGDFAMLAEIDAKCSGHQWFVSAHADLQVDTEPYY